MMHLTSYTGTLPELTGLFNSAVRWLLHGNYSHTELVFSDGRSVSCLRLDGGIRLKKIDITADPNELHTFLAGSGCI